MRCSVKTKLILFALIIFAAAAAAFSFLSYSAAKRSAETVAVSVIDRSAVSAANALSDRIESMMSLSQTVSKDMIMLRAIDDARINQLNVKNEGCLGSGVTFDAAYSDTLRSIDGSTDYSDNPAVKNAAAGTAFFSAPYDCNGKSVVCYAAPFDYRLQSGSCVIVCIADSCFIDEIFGGISLGDSCSVYLADENGIIAGKASSAEGIHTAEAKVSGRESWRICVDAVPAELMPDLTSEITAVVGFSAVLAFIFCIVIAVTLGRTLSPISKLSNRIAALAEGDFTSPVPKVRATDESAVIAESLDKTITALNGCVRGIEGDISDVAARNISECKAAYSGDFKILHDAVSKVKALFRSTLSDIRDSSVTVLDNAEKIGQNRPTVNISSYGEIDFPEPNRENIDEYAKKTARKLGEIGELLNMERERLARLTEAVTAINGKTDEIAAVAVKIDDIAFQTNFLALNAAIEASAAGLHGRAFAVVADEVRSLSQESSEAAKSTTALVKETVKSIGNGAAIAKEAEELLEKAAQAAAESEEYLNRLEEAEEEYSREVKSAESLAAAKIAERISVIPQTGAEDAETIIREAKRLKKIADSFRM